MRWFVPSFCACALVCSTAHADGDRRGDKESAPAGSARAQKNANETHNEIGEKREKPEPTRAEGARKERDDDDDDDKTPDGGKAISEHRSPEQKHFRREVWERRDKAIEAAVHKRNKRITEEEREVIRRHYAHLARLLRVRELAQEDRADAIVKRVDAALDRAEKNCQAKLEKLNEHETGEGK